MGFYDTLAGISDSLLTTFKQGSVTLNRLTFADPDPSTPWLPGAQTTVSYDLRATVRGVKKEHLADTLIVASDLVVTASPKALHNGVEVSISPTTRDVVVMEGRVHEIKKVEQLPAVGTTIAFVLFVAA